MVMFHEPGIYFSMPEAEYHADAALGSTDMKRLERNPEDYWFGSPLNETLTKSEQEATAQQAFGTACHKMLLEGRDAFERRYHVCDFPGNIKAGKEERAFAEACGKLPIKRDDYERIHLAGATVRADPALAEAFSGGVGSEVSIIYRDAREIPKKARIDVLKIRATVDLKTISPTLDLDFPGACWRAFSAWRYDIQAEHYNDARRQIPALLKAGCVFGDHDADRLAKIAAEAKWASAFIFLKKTDAPLTFGLTLSPGNGILDVARNSILKADENYLSFRDRFGLETPWITHYPLSELDINDLPPWYGR